MRQTQPGLQPTFHVLFLVSTNTMRWEKIKCLSVWNEHRKLPICVNPTLLASLMREEGGGLLLSYSSIPPFFLLSLCSDYYGGKYSYSFVDGTQPLKTVIATVLLGILWMKGRSPSPPSRLIRSPNVACLCRVFLGETKAKEHLMLRKLCPSGLELPLFTFRDHFTWLPRSNWWNYDLQKADAEIQRIKLEERLEQLCMCWRIQKTVQLSPAKGKSDNLP